MSDSHKRGKFEQIVPDWVQPPKSPCPCDEANGLTENGSAVCECLRLADAITVDSASTSCDIVASCLADTAEWLLEHVKADARPDGLDATIHRLRGAVLTDCGGDRVASIRDLAGWVRWMCANVPRAMIGPVTIKKSGSTQTI